MIKFQAIYMALLLMAAPVFPQTEIERPIVKVIPGYILVEGNDVGVRGDTLEVISQTAGNEDRLAYAVVLETRSGRTACRLLEGADINRIRIGDITRSVDYLSALKPGSTTLDKRPESPGWVQSWVAAVAGNFGRSWGQKPDSAMSSWPVRNQGCFRLYDCAEHVSGLQNVDELSMLYHNDAGLVKIGLLSGDIMMDRGGRRGRQIFNMLADSLSRLLPEVPGLGLTEVSSEDKSQFYPQLTRSDWGLWQRFYRSRDREVLLSLKGIGKGQGYIELIVEAYPTFARLK